MELLARQRGPEVQFEGTYLGIKVEKLENYNGSEGCDLDTWLFHVREHLGLTIIPEWGHILNATSLL